MDNRTVIGSRINSALAFSNKKQKELAAHLGVPDNTISYFCSGKRVPNAEQIIEISKYLGVSSDYILGLTDNLTTDKDLDDISKYTGLNEITLGYIKLIEKEGYISTLNTLLTSFNMITILENIDNALKVVDNFSNDTDMINDIFNEFIDDITNSLFMKVTLSDKQNILIHLYTVCQLRYKDKVDYYHYKCQKALDEAMQTHEMKLYDTVIKEMANRIYKMYLKYCEEVPDNGEHNPSEE